MNGSFSHNYRHKYRNKKYHCNCHETKILRGPPGPMGPPGPTTIVNQPDPKFQPFILNRQFKMEEPIELKEPGEILILTATISIPEGWESYDLILTGEVFVDEVDVNCGVVMTFKRNQTERREEEIGSQIIGYNGTSYQNGLGFSGYHKEILNDETQTGEIGFSMSVKTVNTLNSISYLSDIVLINGIIHIQAIRQS